ncbi:bacteriocin biosynthesis protein SagD, partial [Natronomonas sp. CBA1123]|nr:bacteriocin biosynthesis protein SagD [Natronomonas sp. CBA1123]
MTTVGLLGGGPAVEAIRSALSDTDAEAVAIDADSIGATDVAAAVGSVGDDGFAAAAAAARRTDTALLAVELGGIGGLAVEGVDAAISG